MPRPLRSPVGLIPDGVPKVFGGVADALDSGVQSLFEVTVSYVVEDLAGSVAELLAAELLADPVARLIGAVVNNTIVSLFEVAVGNLV